MAVYALIIMIMQVSTLDHVVTFIALIVKHASRFVEIRYRC